MDKNWLDYEVHGDWGYTAWHQVPTEHGYNRKETHTFTFWDKWVGPMKSIKLRVGNYWYVKEIHVHVDGEKSATDDGGHGINPGGVHEISLPRSD